MNEYVVLTTILLLGVAFGLFGRLALINMFKHIDKIKKQIANNKAFAAKEAQVALMKARGDFHQWQNLPDGSGGTIMVCVKTGWAPSIKGYIPMENINRVLEDIKSAEEYKVFRAARVQLLAHELQMDIPRMEFVVQQISSMKKDFTLLRMAKLSEDMKRKAPYATERD
jgi:hypothetical protein